MVSEGMEQTPELMKSMYHEVRETTSSGKNNYGNIFPPARSRFLSILHRVARKNPLSMRRNLAGVLRMSSGKTPSFRSGIAAGGFR
jgi:hypothetical protein